jgi:type I restriction enzyme S subunit
MANWPTIKLAECVNLLAGFPFKSQNFTNNADDVPLVKGENVSQGCILWDISKRWPSSDWKKMEKFHLVPRDVVIAMDRPWIPAGLKWSFIREGDPKALLVQRCARLRSSNGCLDQDFLRFVIGSPGFENYVKPITTGVNVPHISGQQILDFEFTLPSLPVQRRIAGILSAYDGLMENSQRRIRILEAMARALYREWFVHFRFPCHEKFPRVASALGDIPQGWEVKKLGEILELNYGKALKQEDRSGGTVPVYGSSGVVGHHDTALVRGPGIVVGRKGNVGSVFWSNEGFYPIDTSYFVTSTLPLRFLFYDLQTKNFLNNDAAVPGLNRNQAYSLETVIPPLDLLKRFCQLADNFERQASILRHQIQNLRRTCDLLLPRLLSGQVNLRES